MTTDVDPAESEEPMSLDLESYHDDRGTVRRSLSLRSDGGLELTGHDMGGGVESAFGFSEYEFVRTLNAEAVKQLTTKAGLGSGPLLLAIRDRFATSTDLEKYLAEQEIESTFWSRIGD